MPVSFLKISTQSTILCGSYASPNVQNRMCELCTFSQIRSQLLAVQTFAIGQYIAFFDKSMSHSLVGLLYK